MESRERSLRWAERTRGPGSLPAFRAMSSLGECLRKAGRPEDALAVQQRALGVARERRFSDENHASAEFQVGATLAELGRWAEAETHFVVALGCYDAARDAKSSFHALAWLAAAKRRTGEIDAAVNLTRDAYVRVCSLFGQDTIEAADIMENLSDALRIAGAVDEAEYFARLVGDIRARRLGADHPETLDAVEVLGVLLMKRGDFAAARVVATSLEARRRSRLGDDHEDTKKAANLLAWAKRVNRPGSDGGSGYWIPTSFWSDLPAA